MESDENMYHATPQVKGKLAHSAIDEKSYSSRKSDIVALSVYSSQLKLVGKIDLYKCDKKILIERKFSLKQIFRGQLYQLWAQYFCLLEMGYLVDKLAFYETSTNKMIPIELPGKEERAELEDFIEKFRSFSPETSIPINKNKCIHCIYCNLCDKTELDNVYT